MASFAGACGVGLLALLTYLAVEILIPLQVAELNGDGELATGLVLPGALITVALSRAAGHWSDRRGDRRVAVVGAAVMAVAAGGLSTVAGSGPVLVGAGMLVLVRGFVLVVVSAVNAAARALTPARMGVGLGLLLQVWSWRAVFGLNVVLAGLAILGGLRFIPDSADPNAPRLDLLGSVLTVAGLGVLVYSIIQAPTQGWGSARTLGGIAGGVVVLAGFIGWELTRTHPLLDPRLFAHRAFTAGTVSTGLQFFAFFGFVFLLLQYLQLVRGNSPLVAAVSLIPMALAMMPAARLIAPRMSARTGPRRVCVLGLVLIIVGLLVLSRLDVTSGYWLLLSGLLPFGAGMGLAMTPATTAITDALPVAQQGVGSAMNDLARELGGALGIAVLGSVLQSTYRHHLHPTGVPEPIAERARSSLALASQLGPTIAHQAQAAFTDGMQTALIYAAAAVALAAVAVVGLLHDHADHSTSAPDPEAVSRRSMTPSTD